MAVQVFIIVNHILTNNTVLQTNTGSYKVIEIALIWFRQDLKQCVNLILKSIMNIHLHARVSFKEGNKKWKRNTGICNIG